MSWSTHPTIITGQSWTATDQNTYVKGNLDTLFPYTTSLQIAYSTSTSSLSYTEESGQFFLAGSNVTNTAITSFAYPMIYRIQCPSTSSWISTSTSTSINNYTPSNSYIQTGSLQTTGPSQVITFPVAFSKKPIVFVLWFIYDLVNHMFIKSSDVATNQFSVELGSFGSTSSGWSSLPTYWLAMGEI